MLCHCAGLAHKVVSVPSKVSVSANPPAAVRNHGQPCENRRSKFISVENGCICWKITISLDVFVMSFKQHHILEAVRV